LHDSKEIDLFDKVSAIRYAKILPQGDYTRYDQIREDQEIRLVITKRSETTFREETMD
jgi:hypothetical protein